MMKYEEEREGEGASIRSELYMGAVDD